MTIKRTIETGIKVCITKYGGVRFQAHRGECSVVVGKLRQARLIREAMVQLSFRTKADGRTVREIAKEEGVR